eukprot:Protomagalhaensia_wolfi_Nauph_80__6221@NODE_934_length_1870_cov_54_286182_g705_i0_p2_GENE_NODE_934_length_1870_cov_54_286182_g705_i0NODE_934_length_1870_cov_54_286182_g705_i0_p2_ORF_typecomplete_len104_score8_82_NODE_934_length_1870_cov_54_286182_g705_i0302613
MIQTCNVHRYPTSNSSSIKSSQGSREKTQAELEVTETKYQNTEVEYVNPNNAEPTQHSFQLTQLFDSNVNPQPKNSSSHPHSFPLDSHNSLPIWVPPSSYSIR